MHRIVIPAAFLLAAFGSLSTVSASAAPNPAQAQVTSEGSSPIIQVDRRCGHGRHFVPRHRVRGHDGRLHWIGGVCIRNH